MFPTPALGNEQLADPSVQKAPHITACRPAVATCMHERHSPTLPALARHLVLKGITSSGYLPQNLSVTSLSRRGPTLHETWQYGLFPQHYYP
jgi:hypothetical protein